MLQGRHYQNAYVTRDIDRAIERFRRQADIRQEAVIEAPLDVQTPDGRRQMTNKLAFIWIGDLQVELIQPLAGNARIYADALPPGDDAIAFHHIAMRVPDWAGFRDAVGRGPYPVAMEGAAGPLNFLYLDARPWLGHYVEYVSMPDEMWTMTGGR